jgi:hypothetical protein
MMLRRLVRGASAALALSLCLFSSAFGQTPTPTYPQPWAQIGTTVSLSAGTSSSNIALGGSTTGARDILVVVCNSGSNDGFVALGGSGVVATTSSIRVPANNAGCTPLQANGATYIAGITAVSTTTLFVQVGQGTYVVGAGGGGSGGGGGTPGGSVNSVQYQASGSTFGGITPLTSGKIIIGQASGPGSPESVSGDATLTPGGALTVVSLDGTAYGTAVYANNALVGTTVAVGDTNATIAATTGFEKTSGTSPFSAARTWTLPCSTAVPNGATSGFLVGISDAAGLINGSNTLTVAVSSSGGCTDAMYAGSTSTTVVLTTANAAATLRSTAGGWIQVPGEAPTQTAPAGQFFNSYNNGTFGSAAPASTSNFATGTGASLTGPSEYYVCTSTCTVSPPAPSAGSVFTVQNGDNVATVITLAALPSSGVYQNQSQASYGSTNQTIVSGGAIGDKITIRGLDSTHYLFDGDLSHGIWTGGGSNSCTITGVSLSANSFLVGSASGTAVGTASATTTGTCGAVAWSLSGTSAGIFSINSSTGALTTNGIISGIGSYSINVVATISGASGSPFTQAETISATAMPAPTAGGFTTLQYEDQFTESNLNTSTFWSPCWSFYGGSGGGFGCDTSGVTSPFSAPGSGGSQVQYYDGYSYQTPWSPGNTTGVHLAGGGTGTSGGLQEICNTSTQFASYSWACAGLTTASTPATANPHINAATGGTVQIRARMMDARYGGWGALWLLSDDTNQLEFDIIDGGVNYTSVAAANTQMFSKWFGGSGAPSNQATGLADLSAGFHTYQFTLISGTSMTVYLDGTQIWQTTSNVPSSGYYSLIMTAQIASSNASGYHTLPNPSSFPGPFTEYVADVQFYH